MSDGAYLADAQFIDQVALKVQEFHRAGKLGGGHPLLRIDNRDRAAKAPFQLDVSTGQLHRQGCSAIPKRARSSLYGLWRLESHDELHPCARCKPVSKDEPSSDPEFVSDLLYGFLSIVAQFGEVLRERGQEYRSSSEGTALHAHLGKLYHDLGASERKALEAVASSLAELASTVRTMESELNGSDRGRTMDGNGSKPKRKSRSTAEPQSRQN